VDYISRNLQDGQQTDILILDFAKAFDKINHSLLIHKLQQHYGIIGKSVRWIQNWLANRKQSVVIDGSTSDAVSVDSGVPQGSVLGPGLFLYNINDL
jgi:retron-type reverse transcriptase